MNAGFLRGNNSVSPNPLMGKTFTFKFPAKALIFSLLLVFFFSVAHISELICSFWAWKELEFEGLDG